MSEWQPCSQEHLLDRIQIEDLLIMYYTTLVDFDRTTMAHHFTEDAVLDINGKIMRGHKEIDALYANSEAILAENELTGTYHMLMNNPRIQVKGDTATAHLLYTGLMCDDLRGPPRLIEMGREYDEFVKVDGRWLISKRELRPDAGMQDFYANPANDQKG
jgi:SnoaL-like protein